MFNFPALKRDDSKQTREQKKLYLKIYANIIGEIKALKR